MDSAFYKINKYNKTENDSLNVVKNSCEKNSSLFQSVHTYEETDDSWKPSALGIKCYSVKHDGYVFLTRKILDLSSTDGKRKIDVCYSYAKDYKNGHKIKPRGSNLQNCSFCDTVSLDFDPDSTLFDLVMEVQIITLAPTRKPIENGLNRNIEQKGNKDNPESPVPFTDTGQTLDESSDPEETNITSVYDLRILGRRDSESNSAFFSPDLELSKRLSEEETKLLEGDGQKIIIKTVIKSENENENGSNNSINYLNRLSPINDKLTNKRSNSTSSLLSNISENSSKGYWSPRKFLSPNKQSSPCESRSSSRRSIYTTVEFFPPCENYVEMVDLSNEHTNDQEKFFNDVEMIDKVEEQIRKKIENNRNEKENENDFENMLKMSQIKKNIETNDKELKILKESNKYDFNQEISNRINLKKNEIGKENLKNTRQKSEEKGEILKKDKNMFKRKKSLVCMEKENVTNSEFVSDSQESLVNTNQGKNFPSKSEIQTCEEIEQEKSLAKNLNTENEKESNIVEKQLISNIEAEYKYDQKILDTEKADNFSESFSTNVDESESVDNHQLDSEVATCEINLEKKNLNELMLVDSNGSKKGLLPKLIYEKKIVFSSSKSQKIDLSSNIDLTEKIEKNHLNSFQVLVNNYEKLNKEEISNEEEKDLELNFIDLKININKEKKIVEDCLNDTSMRDFTDPTKGEISFEEYKTTNDPFELTVTKEGTKASENIVNSLFSRLFKTDTAFSNDKESLENFTLSSNQNNILKILNSNEKSATDSNLYFFSSPTIRKTSKSIPDCFEFTDQLNESSNDFDYRNLIHKFNVKDFSEINTLFQDSFFRASLSINKAKRIMFNEIVPILSPNDVPSFDLIDIANVQNLKFNKPFFDDFANFYPDEIQFSKYQLLVNSKRFDFLNNLERNGTPFFYIQDNHRFFNDLENTFSLKNFVGFLIICSGAFTLYTTSLE
ncbi:unnamed protein product [Brachionus calyciflorus]|uniref:C2 NT-type domain-containing protein n=1 Tax=Brachionus calyciflorus TaxID=104777 RepID=A0A813TTU4_9BILA|nr:unnamed protein product [Brachionus calyciflorus]